MNMYEHAKNHLTLSVLSEIRDPVSRQFLATTTQKLLK